MQDLCAELLEQVRGCRIRRLEDRDGDGRYETSRVFVDALVHLVGGGLYPYAPDVDTPQPVTGDFLPAIARYPAVAAEMQSERTREMKTQREQLIALEPLLRAGRDLIKSIVMPSATLRDGETVTGILSDPSNGGCRTFSSTRRCILTAG